MRRISLHMFVTFDGRAEFPRYPGSDESPTYPDPNFTDMWTKHYKDIDTILLGRKAFEEWSNFWPLSARKAEDPKEFFEFSEFVGKCQKIAFSNSLQSANWENARIMRGDLRKNVLKLREEPGKGMALGGGPMIAQSFMKYDLIDDYFFTVFPVILGQGKHMFENLLNQVTLKLVETKSYKAGEIFFHYERTLKE